ncbi:MAG: hypothetical protein PF689_04940, partial [Deltaproteobacteria bacterium]|nr:hypothetical protein [Deltaproteobacteria bacterium]
MFLSNLINPESGFFNSKLSILISTNLFLAGLLVFSFSMIQPANSQNPKNKSDKTEKKKTETEKKK